MDKICSRCKEPKKLSEFNKDSNRSDGLSHRCRCCQKEYSKQWRSSSETYKQYQEDYLNRNIDRIRERKAKYYQLNKTKFDNKRFERKYGMTREQAENLLLGQDGCAICHAPNPGKNGWCVDHDHITGKVRGILCGKCNSGLGLLGDTKEAIERALAYLTPL